MYQQPAYAESDIAALHAGMHAWSFATLVTHGRSGLQSTPLPFLFDADRGPQGTLVTHLARHNPVYADLREANEVLVIFQGPHAFVSPSWYENQMTFPTWNYTLIHARGKPVLDESEAAVMRTLRRTVARYDTPLGGAWDFEAIPMSHTGSRLKVIGVLEIPITTLSGKMKLNQDKSVEDRRGVVAALEALGEPDGLAVARLIRAQPDMQNAFPSQPIASPS
jgi:transcriptional regulator